MTHEPECLRGEHHPDPDCVWCHAIRRAYRRGFAEGYNDHARSRQHWQDTHGAYRMADQATEPVTTTTIPEPPPVDPLVAWTEMNLQEKCTDPVQRYGDDHYDIPFGLEHP